MPTGWRVAAIAALTAVCVQAQTADEGRARVDRAPGADRFTAGCPVRVEQPLPADAFLAGCSVEVGAAIGGDALVLGGHVRVGAPVGQSLYAAGGQLSIDTTVARNVRIAGGQVVFGTRSEVAGNVLVAGGDLRLEGTVKGEVRAAGGRVRIDGTVGGDVVATAGTLELGPNARIAGQVRYASREDLRRDAAARVGGDVQRRVLEGGWPVPERAERSVGGAGGWIWSLGLMALAAVLVAAAPGVQARLARMLRTRAGMSLLVGFVALVCVPVAAAMLAFTLIGVPLALMTAALYFVLLVLGYVSSGVALGLWALGRLRAERADARAWQIGAAVLGVLAISLLGRLPLVGTAVVLAALLAGVGALLLQLRANAETA